MPNSSFKKHPILWGICALILLGTTIPTIAHAVSPTVKAKPIKKPKNQPVMTKDTDELNIEDIEDQKLPAYADDAKTLMGKMETYVVNEEDTFLDIARHFNLGYVELRAANPDVDPWAPIPGTEILIPSMNILPRAAQKGIIVNLGKMRLYYFKNEKSKPISYPLGIGREGLATPTGETTIVRKRAYPSWYPTPRMREENPSLPISVPPGNQNPLGTHALYLGWPTFLIHGSNKPWGIGRRVSSGCLRMYPEDIIEFFKKIPVTTPVSVVDQPILIARHKGKVYLEANPTKTQSQALEYDQDLEEKPMTDKQREMITEAIGDGVDINWSKVREALLKRSGYPVIVGKVIGAKVDVSTKDTPTSEKPRIQKTTYTFNN